MGAFAVMAELYAHYGVATYPLRPDKAPAIKRPESVGIRASLQLAESKRFADAEAFGFVAGARSRLTIVDIDSPDDGRVREAEDRFGVTPLHARTPSGGRHLYYRHGGEHRQIRPDKTVPIDILGGGNVVGIGSRVARGVYHLEKGDYDDLRRLPLARSFYAETPAMRALGVEQGRRNNELYRHLMRQAPGCASFDELLGIAHTFNEACIPPEIETKVFSTAKSVWAIETRGDNGFGRRGAYISQDDLNDFWDHPPALMLMMKIKELNKPDAEFLVADGFSRLLEWDVKRLRAARRVLLEKGYIELVRTARRGHAALYRRTERRPQRQEAA